MAKHDDVKEDKKLIKSMVKPTSLKKGMAKGGVTSAAMKAVGRNVARANNQRSSGRGG
jgi:hypothetical protein